MVQSQALHPSPPNWGQIYADWNWLLLVTGRRNQSMEESKVPEPDSQGLSTD
jgi:hypothetical protein